MASESVIKRRILSTMSILAIVGATASGKSGLAIQLALQLAEIAQQAEIVNADSMAVYRGMDIGTAKPTAAQRAAVPHHLIDIMDITETATVAEFQTLARAAITEIQARNAIAIVVGGSALYMHAILDELKFPGTDPAVRAKWQARLDAVGSEVLWGELAALSPQAASGILPGNGRRIVRALEVVELTGEFTSHLPHPRYALPGVVQLGVALPQEVVTERIAARVDRMWDDGLLDEVRHLEGMGLRSGVTASRALGYAQVLAHFDGLSTADEAREHTKVVTRKFSRKQLAWFKRDSRIEWVEPANFVAYALRRLLE
ncbi:MAG: tRNA (adenosine(37)-N6)-dimethylallyltransferase MiaA [Propionibacteriaceae bacterium]|jgi:tRNA dimethylallyltransferase|nr:tRNA (adenosine(37)-N6)-dimethylallyltransferase MiaA [Propionibacteriaceae bacterium]